MLTKLTLVLLFGAVLINARVKEFKIESIEFSPGSEELFTFTHTMTQINASTISFSGEYNLKQELDNSYTVQMIASLVTRGNSFFEVYRSKPQGICDMGKSASAMVEIPEMCPIPPTEGTFEDQVVNFEKLMSAGIAGKMKIEVIIKKDDAEKAKATMVIVTK